MCSGTFAQECACRDVMHHQQTQSPTGTPHILHEPCHLHTVLCRVGHGRAPSDAAHAPYTTGRGESCLEVGERAASLLLMTGCQLEDMLPPRSKTWQDSTSASLCEDGAKLRTARLSEY
jgi:hypothetical protein